VSASIILTLVKFRAEFLIASRRSCAENGVFRRIRDTKFSYWST